MKQRLAIIVFSFLMCFFSLYSFGQGGKNISIKDVSGVTKNGDNYEVVDHINLKGQTLVVPKGSTISFKGGRITNGTVILNETHLDGNVKIEGDIKGTICNTVINASWFGLDPGNKSDQTKKLQAIVDLYKTNVSHNSWDINLENPEPTIFIPAGKYYVGEITLRSYVTLKGAGRGSTELHGAKFYADKQYNFTIEDLSIVGDVKASKKTDYSLESNSHQSAFKFKDCARLIFKNVCVRNYDVAFDNYNTFLVDLYSCFLSYCNVGFLNDGKGAGYGGHAVRWYGGEIYQSKYGFVQKNGNGVLVNGATIENCEIGFNFIYPTSFTVDACYFEGNKYDIFGTVVHVNIENCFFSNSGKDEGGAYIYAKSAIGYAIFQGNKFSLPVYGNPHILVDEDSKIFGNIMIGQNDIMHGGRIPVSERLLPYVIENGVNKYQTYLPDGTKMLMGQTIIYNDSRTGKYYIVTRDIEGDLLFSPFYNLIE